LPAPGAALCCVTSVDVSGRLGDRTLIRTLGWSPGTRLDVREDHERIVIVADSPGLFRVTCQGYLMLPAAARHWCRLASGDRVLAVAEPTDGWMVVHPPAALDAMVIAAHFAVWGGEQ
jgi:bifunctional DNA-binding transcriptional regulator/antitoxin component of YhaV-PrlF toxin-antitoxin module